MNREIKLQIMLATSRLKYAAAHGLSLTNK